MAFIEYRSRDEIPASCRVGDDDNILRIHGIHPEVMKHHYDLYLELMHGAGPLTRAQREMLAVLISGINGCRY